MRIRVGAGVQQRNEDCRVLVVHGRDVKGSHSRVALCIHVSAGVQQRRQHRRVLAGPCHPVQGGFAISVTCIGVSPGVEAGLRHLGRQARVEILPRLHVRRHPARAIARRRSIGDGPIAERRDDLCWSVPSDCQVQG